MDSTTIRFARAAREADVAVFYYSGHAMQFAGVNYLMPVDAKLTDEADLRLMSRVDDIVADLQQAKNLRSLSGFLPRQSARRGIEALDRPYARGRHRARPCQDRQPAGHDRGLRHAIREDCGRWPGSQQSLHRSIPQAHRSGGGNRHGVPARECGRLRELRYFEESASPSGSHVLKRRMPLAPCTSGINVSWNDAKAYVAYHGHLIMRGDARKLRGKIRPVPEKYQMSRPSTFSVSDLIRSGMRCICGLTSTALR